MAQDDEPCRLEPPSRYADEDTRTTSKKELWGWYSYGFAAEVFVVCGIGKRMVISTILSNLQCTRMASRAIKYCNIYPRGALTMT